MFFPQWLGIVFATGVWLCTSIEPVRAAPDTPPAPEQPETRKAVPADPASTTPAPATTPVPGTPPPTAEPATPAPAPTKVEPKISYSQVHVDGPYIAYTFDDGPHPKNTPKLLDILKAHNVKATFFVVGENAKQYPNLIKRILAEGHEIGNHTYTHPLNITRLSDEKVRREVEDTAKVLADVADYHPRIFRPPGGATNDKLKEWFYKEYGYTNILWSVDPFDWKKPGVSVVQKRLISGAQPGAILLSHDIHAPTIQSVPGVLDALQAKGYKFVTVSELIALETPTPQPAPKPPKEKDTPKKGAGSKDSKAKSSDSSDTSSTKKRKTQDKTSTQQ